MSEGQNPTFSQAEVDAAVAKATQPLEARLAELEGAATAAELEQKIADAVKAAVEPLEAKAEELDTKVKELQAELDTRTAELNAEKERADALQAEKEQAEKDAEEAAALEARLADRTEKAKSVGGYTDEQLAEKDPTGKSRIERFVAMEDDAFAAALVEIAAARGKRQTSQPPASSRLVASRDEGSDSGSRTSALRQSAAARRGRGADLSSLTRR